MLQRFASALGMVLSLVLSTSPARAAGSSAPASGAITTPSVTPSVVPSGTPARTAGGTTASSAPASGTIVSVEGTESAQLPVTAPEKKTLLSEYNRAQSNEEKALRHVSKSQMRELTAAQSQRNRTWHEQEKRARRDFFAAHTSGPERRKYVQDYIQRKKDFDLLMKNEYEAARKDSATKLDQLLTRQKDQRKKFKAALDQGQRPSADLWPH
jgi:hypothetical protein